ncbi:hypothetical protein BDN70DRAFT_58423 [Pholiota conissans]|uniref:Uncharacterized protein n=1 Tax=Pholiota conissans TaxID=109636 RepID=A0A9P6CZD3_9AGAR|nr:hypothetical protein BDN70DRAFT_58423 [Pholiota conissans]
MLELYSDALFKYVATKWFIETDQPIRAFEHPAFQEMIAVAARATKGVKVPARLATRKHIIDKFKEQMRELSGGLTVWSSIGYYYVFSHKHREVPLAVKSVSPMMRGRRRMRTVILR